MDSSNTFKTHLKALDNTRQSSNRVLSCMPYAVKVAKQYAKGNVDLLQDYIQDGYEGLLVADQRFDETRGTTFLTFAAWYVRAYIQQGQRKNAYCVAATNLYQNKNLNHQPRPPKAVDLDDHTIMDTLSTDFELDPDWCDVMNCLPLELGQYLALRLKVENISDLESITGESRSTLHNKKLRILKIMGQ